MLNTPVSTLLRTIPNFKSAIACFGRIQSFLGSDSRQFHVLPLHAQPDSDSSGPSIDPVSTADTSAEDGNFELADFTLNHQRSSKVVLDVRNASFGWSHIGPPQVNDVSFSVLRGDFVFVIGPVGCGKSTLLKGLISETPSLKGFVYSNSLESAFADQTPWVQNTTIRQNIVGTSTCDESWYKEVIEACSLDHDIAVLPDSHGMCAEYTFSRRHWR